MTSRSWSTGRWTDICAPPCRLLEPQQAPDGGAAPRADALHAPVGAAELTHAGEAPGRARAVTATVDQGLKLVRTLSRNRRGWLSFAPGTRCAEIEDEHLRMIGAARRLIYIESQFLRSQPVAEALAQAARAVPGLGLIMVLPAAPEQIAFEGKSGIPERFGEHLHHECVKCVREGFGERLPP